MKICILFNAQHTLIYRNSRDAVSKRLKDESPLNNIEVFSFKIENYPAFGQLLLQLLKRFSIKCASLRLLDLIIKSFTSPVLKSFELR